MVRSILAVVTGYVAAVVLVLVSFVGAYQLLGTDGVLRPGSYEPSGTWLLISIVFGLVAAVVAGLVCAAIAKSQGPVLALAGVMLVLGLILAVPVLTSDPGPATRDESVSDLEALQNARQPGWAALLNPVLGAAGVLLGGRLKRAPGT